MPDDKKRHSFLFKRPRPLAKREDVKALQDMSPHEVDAEIKVRIRSLQEKGVVPVLSSPSVSKQVSLEKPHVHTKDVVAKSVAEGHRLGLMKVKRGHRDG